MRGRVNNKRASDNHHQIGRCGNAGSDIQSLFGQLLTKEHGVGSQDAATFRTAGIGFTGFELYLNLIAIGNVAIGNTPQLASGAVQLDHPVFRHTRFLVQAIDILRDHGDSVPLCHQVRNRKMTGVWLAILHEGIGFAPVLPELESLLISHWLF